MKPSLTISVLTYNRWRELLPACLASIDEQQLPTDCEKLIINNGNNAKDDISDMVRLTPPGWTVHTLQQNRGQIGGQNVCFEVANGDWVLFVSDDVRLQPDAVLRLWMSRQPDAVLQPIIENPNGSIQNAGMDWWWPGYGIGRRAYRHEWTTIVPSITYLMPRDVWNLLGGFDENLQFAYEDVDFGLRMFDRGIHGRVIHDAHATHLANQTLKHTMTHHRQRFHEARLQVIRKHYTGVDRWLRVVAVTVIDGIRKMIT